LWGKLRPLSLSHLALSFVGTKNLEIERIALEPVAEIETSTVTIERVHVTKIASRRVSVPKVKKTILREKYAL
jgi:hypothetical protein